VFLEYHQKKQDALKSPLGDLGAAQMIKDCKLV